MDHQKIKHTYGVFSFIYIPVKSLIRDKVKSKGEKKKRNPVLVP